ncbi:MULTISPECIES: hypothetical protein [Micromonospora]|uniref:hypothetical protein n=1 Tax=Micromonospora TaxID=1873 RepID=UPI0011CEC761|nr:MULTISPECIES: hypothetical protein [Micromonospora]NES14578.1 hypothetical protein [Micromonospora sp. PPF5-17B]NES35284.1 hypothetical protein [Micromonospora solifontis]
MIPILLILLAFLLVRRVEKNGGSIEIDWKAVAFRIKITLQREGSSGSAEAQEQRAQPEVTTAASAPQAIEGPAEPPSGGGGP